MEINLLYRPSQTIAQCWLDEGEEIVADAGALMGMSSNVHMQTHSGSLSARMPQSAASLATNLFRATEGDGEVLLTAPLAGDMHVIEVGEQHWQVVPRCYVASGKSVVIEPHAHVPGLAGATAPTLFAASGQGPLVLGGFGAIEAVTVDGGMVIDTGHLVAWDANLQFAFERSSPSGWLASWLSGEGMMCRFGGRGVALVQSRNPHPYGDALRKHTRMLGGG